MNVGAIGTTLKSSSISKGLETLGKKVGDSVNMQKIGKFFDPNGKTVSQGVFTTLLLSCVLFPRLLNAQDKTERRETITRDAVAIGTMLFAMKGINTGIAKLMEKKTGLVLTNKVLPKDMNIFKKLGQYLNPNGGVNILSTEQLASKYKVNEASIEGLKGFIKDNGGNLDKIKLSNAADAQALLKKAKSINGGLKTLTLVVTVALLGIGLPVFNILLSKKLDKKEAEEGTLRAPERRENIFIKRLTDEQKQTFRSFLG